MSQYMGAAQKMWVEAIQSRVAVTSHTLGAMRAIKLLGLAETVTAFVQKFRVQEIRLSTRFRKLMTVRIFLGIHPISAKKVASSYKRLQET